MLRLNSSINFFLHALVITTVATSVSTVIVTVPAAAPTDSPSYTDGKIFQKAVIDMHNLYRNEHNASALSWNDTLAEFGTNWVGACEFEHSVSPFPSHQFESYGKQILLTYHLHSTAPTVRI